MSDIVEELQISRIGDVKLPVRGHDFDAGIDFFIPNNFQETILNLGDSILIPSKIKVKVPKGYMLKAENKSGVATKLGLQIGASVVDYGYQGEVHIHLTKVTKGSVVLQPGQKIAQFILQPISTCKIKEVTIEELYESKSERGEGGFGSTGKF